MYQTRRLRTTRLTALRRVLLSHTGRAVLAAWRTWQRYTSHIHDMTRLHHMSVTWQARLQQQQRVTATHMIARWQQGTVVPCFMAWKQEAQHSRRYVHMHQLRAVHVLSLVFVATMHMHMCCV